MAHPPAAALHLSARRRRKLLAMVGAASCPQAVALRARIVLLAADGLANSAIAVEVGCSEPAVRRWRLRFVRRGVPGLFDRPRSGRPERYGPSERLAVIAVATSLPPEGAARWTQTLIAEHLAERGMALSRATVRRTLTEARVGPHKVRGWLNRADDDAFWAKAGAVCRLYLDIPADTLLVSVDEKTGIQARSRIRPTQSPLPGRDRRVEFEYKRHGTVSIVAAMDVATGQVVAERIERNDSAHFIRFLAMLDRNTDPALRIHLVMDNGSSHTSKATRAWLAAHPRFSVTHTPKHASWLNMIEQWFSALTRRVLRGGDFTSRDDLEAKITAFTIRYNRTARPYRWRYDADAEHARYLARHPQHQKPTRDDLAKAA
ncbi:IS630 family transposase [Micromonospora inyonensis]|uniref:Transposase n=1 Tax=Micromonospora inyonensis TaxID=47866 RepID=A0A1C6SCR5_9ACTN|nr:IS630 family transposase [Micromonospora inyonensis]SCL27275.1 Transposase [Micromonospora inyonensis]